MQFIINGKNAVLKAGTSFEFVSENRMFEGADSYTLSISLPLRGCQQNEQIFGKLFRKDIKVEDIVLDAEIHDNTLHKYGCITIVERSDTEVKVQFLEGRSEQNFDSTFDNVYINLLNLGSPATTDKSQIAPNLAWSTSHSPLKAVAMQWVGESGNIQNCAKINAEANQYEWDEGTSGLSWQPYLIYITKAICEAMGYTYDFSAWEDSPALKYLLVCNTLPYAWNVPQFARALPHWTVQEFFEKLEPFMAGEFDIDHRGKHVKFSLTKDVISTRQAVEITDVVDEFSSEIKTEDNQCNYSECRIIKYKDCDHNMWRYYSCDWYIDEMREAGQIVSFDTMAELVAQAYVWHSWDGHASRDSLLDKVLHAKDEDAYFLIRAIDRSDTGQTSAGGNIKIFDYSCILQPINEFGQRDEGLEEDASTEVLEFVPACIDYTDAEHGMCLHLKYNGYDEGSQTSSVGGGNISVEEYVDQVNATFYQTPAANRLAAGESTNLSEYYDRFYIAWWGPGNPLAPAASIVKFPYPMVSSFRMSENWGYAKFSDIQLRVNVDTTFRKVMRKINPAQKTTFKFLSDSIPDVRAIFHIHGRRYVCEKISATITDEGMSRMMKGVFYEIQD